MIGNEKERTGDFMNTENSNWIKTILWIVAIAAIVAIVLFAFGSNNRKTTEKDYIGEEKAKTIALQKAGVKEEDVTFERVELDIENGESVYEVDFYDASHEYDYKIHATTGEVVKEEKEPNRKQR